MIKKILGTFLIILVSIMIAITTTNKFISFLILSSGILNIWFAILNSNYNYIFGSLFYLLNAYISYVNGLYGIAFLSLFVYFPLQIDGFIRWKEEIPIKKLPYKLNICIIISLITSSIGLSLLLHKIPTQSLAYLDASSNISNICGIILMNLKYQEAWSVWLINNVIDLIIWITKSITHSPSGSTLLIVSIGYLLMNIYGLIKWKKLNI